jgi:predicted flap endonuclease-1-like 5' DNA nuclease
MSKLEDLRAELSTLQAELTRIESEGRVLTDCWIAQAKPGGSKKKKYPRLKSRKSMFDGKKTEYLSIHSSAVAKAEAALARGKAVKKLNKRIQTLSEQINQLQDKSSKSPKSLSRKKASQLYTPPEIIDLVRVAMGEIDLDPASDNVAQQWVQARNYYAPALDGLSHPWFGRVWLHPPSDGKTAKWTSKLLDEYESGRVTEAVLLVRPSAGSKWFQKLTRLFSVCFPDERLKFLDDQRIPQPQPKHGNAIFYLGINCQQFGQVFGTIGSVSSPIKNPLA